MPERPDLDYVVPILKKELSGKSITGVRVRKPVVMRVAVPGSPAELLGGRTVRDVERRAHFVLFDFGADADVDLVVSPMLAGVFALAPADAKTPADLAVGLALSDGRELRYLDDVQMGKVYVVRRGDRSQVPGLEKIGIDVLSPKFTREAFRALAKKRRDQAKVFLMDRSALDAMGNAYADEVLWEARLHPKTFVRGLSDEQLDALHDAVVKVLRGAAETIRARKPATDDKLRDFLKVRGRAGEACPRCGAKLRRAGVHGHDADFCPQCQPDVRGSSLVDWRKIPTKE